MKCIAIVLVVALAGGCASSNSGTSVTTGSAGLQVQSNTLAAVVLTGMFVAAVIEDARDPRPFPSLSVFSDWMRSTPPPPLAPDRPVNEQDCSRPIVETGANLRCR